MKGDNYGVYWILNRVLIHHIIKEKSSKNRRKTKRHEENGKNGESQGRTAVHPWTHDRASHHDGSCALPWPARGGHCPARSRRFLNDAFCAPLCLSLGLGSSCFGPPLQLCLIYMALNFIKLGFKSHISPKNLA